MITMKRRLAALLLAGCALLLSGCGNLFDQEYVSITDYEPPAQEPAGGEDSISVRDVDELREVLVEQLNAGAEDVRVIFDAAYAGDINADLAAVCWQVRTRDALFAYCVESISYDVSKLVNHYEVRFTIRYTEADRDSIVRLQLTNGLEAKLREAIQRGDSRLVVLIGRSSLSAEDVESLASRVYRNNPIAEPREPRVTVNMLSGTGMQRLYEINFNYSMSPEELAERRAALQALAPFAGEEEPSADPALRALAACEYLLENCSYTESGQNDIYSALILGEANSEGMALAYVELCRQLDIPCQIVYGQRNWRSHCWNIIQLGGDSYHVDVSVCAEQGLESGFLLPDETMWGHYRWDISSYPPCRGKLSYAALLPPAPEEGGVDEADGEPGEIPSESPEP